MPEPPELSITFTQFNLPEPMGPMFSFIFNPTILTLTTNSNPADQTYQIRIKFETNITGAQLSGGTIKDANGAPAPGSASFAPIEGEPGMFVATFTNTGITPETRMTYNYHVMVTAGGTTYESDDPEIVLGPPG